MGAMRFSAASHLELKLVCLIVAIAVICAPMRVLADVVNRNGNRILGQQDAIKMLSVGTVRLTPSLVAWISRQSEGIIEELEAIAKYNAEITKFSVVSYMRYLTLFNHLKVVASKPFNKFKWIARKAKTFALIYDSAMQMVYNYLHDVDRTLRQIEDKEPKSKQVEPSNDWTRNYEIIRFIALHAPKQSDLADAATKMLASSPNGTIEKARTVRYTLKTQAFSR